MSAPTSLTSATSPTRRPVSNVETLVGGSAADTITLGAALSGSVLIDLGAGSDKLTLGDFANSGSVSNVETLIGGVGADTITLATQVSNITVDLGSGADKLTLGNFANTLTVSNTETLVGGSAADTVTIGTAVNNASLNLGAGNDIADARQLHELGHRLQRRDADRRLGR